MHPSSAKCMMLVTFTATSSHLSSITNVSLTDNNYDFVFCDDDDWGGMMGVFCDDDDGEWFCDDDNGE